MPISQDDFRAALSRFASGVTVVTAKDIDGRLYGITVSAFCSVSLEPPLILVCIERGTGSNRVLAETKVFAVNILSSSQIGLSRQFASQLHDKFAEIDYRLGSNGVPLLEGALANLECSLTDSHDAGDHTVFVGEVENVLIDGTDPLIYFHSGYHGIANSDEAK